MRPARDRHPRAPIRPHRSRGLRVRARLRPHRRHFQEQLGRFREAAAAALDARHQLLRYRRHLQPGRERDSSSAGRSVHRRDRVVIASKAGYVLPSQRKLVAPHQAAGPAGDPVARLSRHHLPSAVRGALRSGFLPGASPARGRGQPAPPRNGLHRPVSTAQSAVRRRGSRTMVGALEALEAGGKIRYYGVSCDTVEAASPR